MPRRPIVARRLIRWRPCAVAVVPTLLFALAGCRPPATSTVIAPPTASPTASSTPWPTDILAPTVTAMFTPQATHDPAIPAPVSMSLDEAKTEALSWFDASRSPRVEWAGYVRREVIGEGLEDRRIYDAMTNDFRPIEDLSVVAIVVEASTYGLGMPLDAASDVHMGVPGNDAGDAVREEVVTVFDTRSGRRFATMLDNGYVRPGVAMWKEAWAPSVTIVPRSPSDRAAEAGVQIVSQPTTSTSTPTLVPTPDAPVLDADHVPSPMRRVLTDYPLLPGSRWSWRVTTRFEGVQWMASTLDEVVEHGWSVADDHVIVQSRRSIRHVSGVRRLQVIEDDVDGDGGVETTIVWRTVRSDGTVAGEAQDAGEGAGFPFIPECCMPDDFPLPAEPWFYSAIGGSFSGGYATKGTDVDVPTIWGIFHRCATMFILPGNGQGTHRAICPGVGYVRTESVVYTTPMDLIEVTDLVSYDVVLPR